MAINFATGGYLHQTATWIDLTRSFTWSFWFRPGTSTPSGGKWWNVAIVQSTAPDPYVFWGSQINSTNLYGEIYDGTSFLDTVDTAAIPSVWTHISLVYDATTHLTTVREDGTSIGTISRDLSSVAWNVAAQEVHIGGESFGDLALAQFRMWQAALSASELTSEAASASAVRSTNLLLDTPLSTSSTLTDLSGNGRTWTSTGSTSTRSGPLGPTNTTIQTAIDLGATLPVTVTTTADDDSGTWDLWYYRDATADEELSVFPFGDLSTYKPGADVYLGPAGSETVFLDLNQGTTYFNVPVQHPATNGTRYFYKIRTNSASASPANLTLLVQRFTNAAAPAGSIAVNDDDTGYPLALLSAANGSVVRFVQNVVAGEGGNVLPNGYVLLTDTFNSGKPTLYDASFNVIASGINYATGGLTENAIQTNKVNAFYIGDGTNGASGHARIAKIDTTGTITQIWTLPAAHIKGLAPSHDETIIYLYGHAALANSNIKQWILASSSFGSDLVAAVAGYEPARDLLCLNDGTIIAGYAKSSPVDFFARRYDTSGSTLNTYSSFTSLDVTFIGDVRLFHAIDDPISFWVWTKTTGGQSTFTNLRVSDGATVTSFSKPYFENGYDRATAAATPSDYFGHSESCPAFALPLQVGSTGTSGRRGIYVPTRGDAGSEGGGAHARFADLNGYPSTSTGFSTTVAGRIIPVLKGAEGGLGTGSSGGGVASGGRRAIYVPTVGIAGAEGDGRISTLAQLAIRRIVVYDGEGYTHR